MIQTVFFFIAICAVLSRASVLSDLPKCKRSDPNFDVCLKSSVEAALRLLAKPGLDPGIPSLEPIVVSKFIVYPVEHFPFEEKYSNVRLYNHSTAKIGNLEAAVTNETFWIKIVGYCPQFIFATDYEYKNAVINGVDFSSSGKMAYTQFGYNFTLTMMGRVPEGSKRLVITTAHLKQVSGGFNTTYTTEDPKLSKALTDIANANWEPIYIDVNDQYEAFFAEAYKGIANEVFSKIDFNEIFPES